MEMYFLNLNANKDNLLLYSFEIIYQSNAPEEAYEDQAEGGVDDSEESLALFHSICVLTLRSFFVENFHR